MLVHTCSFASQVVRCGSRSSLSWPLQNGRAVAIGVTPGKPSSVRKVSVVPDTSSRRNAWRNLVQLAFPQPPSNIAPQFAISAARAGLLQRFTFVTSNKQPELQPSKLAVLPSSHCSPTSRAPLPQLPATCAGVPGTLGGSLGEHGSAET